VLCLAQIASERKSDWHLSEEVNYDTVDFAMPSFTVTDNGMSTGVNSTGALYSYAIPLSGGYDLNGNLLQVTDSVMGTWKHSYDNLNRLTGATAPASQT
jgi:YD repeat-containing protein